MNLPARRNPAVCVRLAGPGGRPLELMMLEVSLEQGTRAESRDHRPPQAGEPVRAECVREATGDTGPQGDLLRIVCPMSFPESPLEPVKTSGLHRLLLLSTHCS